MSSAPRPGRILAPTGVVFLILLLWLWRPGMLARALAGRPADLSVAAWVSLATLAAASVALIRGRLPPSAVRLAAHAPGVLRRLRDRPAGRVGLWGSAAFIIVAALAPALAPCDPNRIGDSIATHHLPPLSKLYIILGRDGGETAANEISTGEDSLRLRRGASWMTLTRSELRGTTQQDWLTTRLHLLGTDHLGRDVLSRLLMGSRVSLAVGLMSALAAALLGGLLGGMAGVAGPRVDGVLMRITDAALSLPRLFLLLLFLSVLPGSVPATVVLLALTGWMAPCRLVRTEVLSLRERDFVHAARALGRRPLGLVIHHLLPNALTTLSVAAGLRVGETMLAEAGLSFLGLGIPPPHATWGNLVSSGRPWLVEAWWVATFPGLALAGAVLVFNLLGDGLRTALAVGDPA